MKSLWHTLYNMSQSSCNWTFLGSLWCLHCTSHISHRGLLCDICRLTEMLKWHEMKIVIGCALFHDILKPAAVICKGLQDDEFCIVGAIEAVLKTTTCLQGVTSRL